MYKQQLVKCTLKNTPRFSFDGQTFLAKCVKVYDGDTITAVFAIKTDEPCFKFSIRLAGVDTPEMRSHDENEKKMAIEARDFVRGRILDKLITIKCGKFDKYGRLLGDIYQLDCEKSINTCLIEKGYANAYDGGTKKAFHVE
jgi:endonuclease YncB( thermonuclease family)